MPPTGSTVELVLNGKKRELLIDTGATGMTIGLEAAQGLGLVPEADVTSAGIGDGGTSSEYIAHLASLKIGSPEFRNCKIRVQRQPHRLSLTGPLRPGHPSQRAAHL